MTSMHREQIDQIRRELLQLSETHRIPKGDEEENKIKLRRIEERLPEFEKQIMLFTNVKEELRKITANYSYLLRKFEKYDENIKNHDNVNNSLKGNEKYHTEKFKTNIRNSEHLDQEEMDSPEKEKYLRENPSGNLVENLLKGNLNLIFNSKKRLTAHFSECCSLSKASVKSARGYNERFDNDKVFGLR